jgi:dihydroneopterin aldolase
MSADVYLAFAHPEARAAATTAPDPETREPLDRISLRDYALEVEIGAFQAERGITQKICFNIAVEVAPLDGPVDDDVDRILSYDRITEAIAAELAAERLNLLETLAERVAERILREPQARRVFVRIEKLDRGPFALGVEIVRSRSAAPREGTEAPQPRVAYLPNAVLAAADLGARIDALVGQGAPLILCVGAPETPAPQVPHPLAQRRVDLLAIEQNAWDLAAWDARCVVVGTRTELDWAIKHGQVSVWVPSKLVLDATEPPASYDAPALAAWLAQQMNALEHVTL